MKVKRILKYGTGDLIPENAVYLTTVVQNREIVDYGLQHLSSTGETWIEAWLVWHYFLVEVEENE